MAPFCVAQDTSRKKKTEQRSA
ncbi:uncharacterized protein G2W53_027770 [Senna tora]|uniref:Uncharacterized protein n=1 Tax=Senna tora TaxID=362788 RepID=A0A834TIB4_9FABA|nr:uncharacterized protein G2W53_027770 [Senna tora]